MRKLFLASITLVALSVGGSALAADMPVKAKAPPPPVNYSWTGFYFGGNVGGGWGTRHVDYVLNDPVSRAVLENAPPPSFHTSGVIGGFQLGYNWQFDRNWLVGLETDFDWSRMKGSGSSAWLFAVNDTTNVPFTAIADEHIKWFGTVRARLGYPPTDYLLVYATGGFAYGKVEHSPGSVVNTSPTVSFAIGGGGFHMSCQPSSACYAGPSLSDVAKGWTVGGGLEYAIWSRWTLKAEYLYISLPGNSTTETAVLFDAINFRPTSLNVAFSRTIFNVARVGMNYRF
jgi:outer membrane immunogenic protein